MRLRLAVLAAFFILLYPSTLLADTYEYQFSSPDTENAQFTFYTGSLITSQTNVIPTSCSFDDPTYGNINCASITADVFNQGDFFLNPPENYENELGIFTGFSFTQLGTQSNPVNSLTITAIPSVTPEPSSILLLGTGMLSMAAIARRRFVHKVPR